MFWKCLLIYFRIYVPIPYLKTKIEVHKAVVLCAFYGCEIWSPIVREIYKLGVVKCRMDRRLFGKGGK
jgi:hypothetical protein